MNRTEAIADARQAAIRSARYSAAAADRDNARADKYEAMTDAEYNEHIKIARDKAIEAMKSDLMRKMLR